MHHPLTGTVIKDVLERFGMTEVTQVSMPMEANTSLTRTDCLQPHKVDQQLRREYQHIVGSLMYLLCQVTCPDLAFSVDQCLLFMSDPGPSHMAAACRMLRYLTGTADLGITYKEQPTSREKLLRGFAYAGQAGSPYTRLGTS
eukprot:1969940-Rhodomonas_salina.2